MTEVTVVVLGAKNGGLFTCYYKVGVSILAGDQILMEARLHPTFSKCRPVQSSKISIAVYTQYWFYKLT